MPLFIENFFLLGVPVGAINAIIIRQRAAHLLIADPALEVDLGRISRGVFLATAVPSLAMAAVQMAAGFKDPFFLFSHNYSDPYVVAGVAVLFATWAWLLWWVWFTDGCDAWARVTPARSGRRAPDGPTLRRTLTAIMLGTMLPFLYRAMQTAC